MSCIESGKVVKIYNLKRIKLLGMMVIFLLGIVVTIPAVTAASDMRDCHGNERIEEIDKAMEKAILFLEEHQLPSGEFPMNESSNVNMSDGVYMTEIFGSTFVLHALNFVEPNPVVNEMKNKTTTFLLSNKEDPGVWRFWGIYSDVPPDMDDTSAAIASLKESGIPLEDSGLEYMLNFRTPDGIFYTYMNEERWLNESNPYNWYHIQNDVDPVVNANVLYAYSFVGKSLPEVSNYINDYVYNNSFTEQSAYYHNTYAQLYMFTRAYADGHVEELKPSMKIIRNYLLSTQKDDGSWGDDLNTNLATVSLLNTGYKGKALNKAIYRILSTQRDNGSWSTGSLFAGMLYWVDPENPDETPDISIEAYGSEEVTTGFALEALSKYKRLKDDGEPFDSDEE